MKEKNTILWEKTMFEEALNQNWTEVFYDSGCENWQEKWFLDGDNARVFNGKLGMEFYTGARYKCDADHGVLWTKESFQGDIKLELDYWRLDNANTCVNIIYLMATGTGEEPYSRDIWEWKELRNVPSMKLYFEHMNAYHISYAAFGLEDSDAYIRARRYRGRALEGTNIEPDYDPEDFFAPMEKHKVIVIKKREQLFFFTENEKEKKLCTWNLDPHQDLREGRIGLRQMFTRNARYANISISQIM